MASGGGEKHYRNRCRRLLRSQDRRNSNGYKNIDIQANKFICEALKSAGRFTGKAVFESDIFAIYIA